jgi:tryptophan synthase alpha chain
MTRLAAAFAAMRTAHRGLVVYVTAGDPDPARSLDVVRAVVRGGADVVELGVPFSDPIADGPAIQRATERALASGGSLARTLDLVTQLREESGVPIVLFTYVNPVVRMGADTFAERAASAGVDGVLLLDLPIEEAGEMRDRLASRGIDQIFLLSPTTTDARLAAASRLGRGFLYAISRLGVTGARDAVAATAEPLVRRIRAASDLPVALGFGISRPEHVTEVLRYADAAVVGSAVVNVVGEAAAAGRDPAPEVERFVRWLRGAGHGRG